MRVLLLPGPTQDVDEVRQTLLASQPDAQVEVCGAESAITWLAANESCDVVVVDAAHIGAHNGRLLPALRSQRPGLPIAVLVAAGDAPGEARALLAGADASVPPGSLGLSRLGALFIHNRRRDVHAQRRGWRLWFAGRDTDLRRRLAEQLGDRVLLMSLSADGRLVPRIEDPSAATALIVDCRDKPGDALMGLTRVHELHPSLATIVIADEDHHIAFLNAGAEDCLPPGADVDRVLLTVDRVVSTRELASEVVALRARENRLRALVEYLPDPVVLVSAARTVLAINLAGLELLGAEEAQHVIGRELTGWLTPEPGTSLDAFIDDVSAGSTVTARASTRHATAPRPVTLHAVPFQREPGKPASVLVVLHEAVGSAHEAAGLQREAASAPPLAHEVDSLRTEVAALSQSLATAHEAMQQMSRRAAELEAAAAGRAETDRRHMEVVATLEHDVEVERGRVAERDASLDAAQKRVSELERALVEHAQAETLSRVATNALEQVLGDECARARDLAAQLGDARMQFDRAQAQADDHEALRLELTALTRERDQLAEALRAADSTALEQALSEARRALDDTEAARAAAQVQMARLEQSALEESLELRARVAALEQQIAALDHDRAMLAERERTALDEAAELRAAIAADRVDAEALAAALQEARGQLDAAHRRAADLDAQEAVLKAGLERAELAAASAEDVAHRLAAMQADREALVDALAAAQHEADVHEAAQADAAQRAEKLSARVTRLERDHADRIAALAQERDELRRELPKLQMLQAELPKLHEAQRRVMALEGQLSETQVVRAQALALETEVSALREAHERSRRLEAELADLRAERESRPQIPAKLEAAVDEETRWLLYEVASIGHLTTTPEARILGANDMAAQLLGQFSRDALQASGRLPDPLLLAAGAFAHRPTRFEVCLQHGEEGPLHWIVGLATPHAGLPATVTWMLIDVSEQRMQARRSRFLRRMEAMTHVLSAATAESSTLVERARPLLDAATTAFATREDIDVEATRSALARTQAVLTQLSGFARTRARRAGVRDVRSLLDESAPVLVHVAGEDITCAILAHEEPLHATVEPAEFEQFLTALVMAGRDALPLGGRLTLKTQPVNSDTRDENTFFTRPSIEITLDAQGYGAQMPEHVQVLQESVQRLGGTFAAHLAGHGEVRIAVRMARVFVTA